jgi:DNA-binding beta-propeller fold protein YncE
MENDSSKISRALLLFLVFSLLLNVYLLVFISKHFQITVALKPKAPVQPTVIVNAKAVPPTPVFTPKVNVHKVWGTALQARPTDFSNRNPGETATAGCDACTSVLFQYGTGAPGSSAGQMNDNIGIALNQAGTSLVVADEENRRVDVFPVGSGVAQTIPVEGILYPFGVAVDPAGNIYVADYNGNQVFELNRAGMPLKCYRTGLNKPMAVALDSRGNPYIMDINKITQLGPGFTGAPRTFGEGEFNMPCGLCVRGTDVFVADTQNNRVDQWTNLGKGSFSVAYTLPDRWYPSGIAFDATGRYAYVSELSNQLEVFDTSGGAWRRAAVSPGGALGRSTGVAVDRRGNYYVSENMNFRVREFPPISCLANRAGEGKTGEHTDNGMK